MIALPLKLFLELRFSCVAGLTPASRDGTWLGLYTRTCLSAVCHLPCVQLQCEPCHSGWLNSLSDSLIIHHPLHAIATLLIISVQPPQSQEGALFLLHADPERLLHHGSYGSNKAVTFDHPCSPCLWCLALFTGRLLEETFYLSQFDH